MSLLQKITATLGVAALALTANVAQAWYVSGQIICDTNETGQTEAQDTPLAGIGIYVHTSAGVLYGTTATRADGTFLLDLSEIPDTYKLTLDLSALPAGSSVLLPTSGSYTFTLTHEQPFFEGANFLVDCNGGPVEEPPCGCEPPPPTPEPNLDCGKLTGGGWIIGTPSGKKGTFSVEGGVRRGEFWGGLNYVDHGTGMHVKSTAVTGFRQDPANANGRIITYNVTINGVAGTATVRAVDNGEPGRTDIFEITCSNGYAAGSELGGSRPGGGNIQLHKCPPGWAK